MIKSIRPVLAVAVTVLLLTKSAFASNPPTFATQPEVFSSSVAASSLVMGDFDGDGVADLAVFGVTNVEVLFGDGKGGFRSSAAIFPIPDSSSSTGIAAADIDGDGKSELLFAASNSVLVYAWTGSSFTQSRVIDLSATGIDATSIATGDVSGRGNHDILVSDAYGAVGLVLISNDGKGDFGTPAAISARGSGFSAPILLGDFNGDGLADVALTGGSGVGGSNAIIGVLDNSSAVLGAETFYSAPSLFGNTNVNVRIQGATIGDVDGDGKEDLVVAVDLFNFSTFTDTYDFVVFLGNGDGTFGSAMVFPGNPKGVTSIRTADANGDGRADIVTSDYADSGFTVTEWTGSGSSLAVLRSDHFPAFGPFFNAMTLGYAGTNGGLVTFNKATLPAVILGTTSYTSTGGVRAYQIDVFTNTTGGSSGTGNSLPPTGVSITNKVTPGGVIDFVATQSSSVAGLYVRIQASKTPTVESSWTDLPGGGMLSSSGNGIWTFGTNGTFSYPTGNGYYFRAISAAAGYTDSKSTNILGPFNLSRSALAIGLALTSSSDPTGKAGIVHIGDKLNYNFTWTNRGTASAHSLIVETPVPTYIDAASDLTVQFPSNALSFNQYGHYVSNSTTGPLGAYVWWNVADLGPGSRQSVTLTVLVGSQVRLQQALGLPNNYEVYSTTQQPPVGATGYGASNVSDTVEGPIAFTIRPDVTSTAPGGYINYILTITNTGSQTATNVVIADPVPAGTDYVPYNATTKTGTTFLSSKGAPILSPPFLVKAAGQSLKLANPLRLVGLYPSSELPAGVKAFLAENPQVTLPNGGSDEIVFYIGTLAKGASATVRLTVQAQYEPAGNFPGGVVQNLDYVGYFYVGGVVVGSKNESGAITTTISGSPQNPPVLQLNKVVSSQSLRPGDILSVILVAKNNGTSAADDVFIQDSLPVAPQTQVQPVLITTNFANPTPVTTSNLNAAAEIITGGASSAMSKTNYFVTLDPGGLITVRGLHLEPGATVGITYFMQILPGTPVPETLYAGGSFVGAGNGSQSPETTPSGVVYVSVPPGIPASYEIQITGNVQLVAPPPIGLVIAPSVTSNPTNTAAQLDALFKKNSNASLVIYTNIGAKKNVPVSFPGVLTSNNGTGLSGADTSGAAAFSPAGTGSEPVVATSDASTTLLETGGNSIVAAGGGNVTAGGGPE
jgi:uncharacterized repeat protein (TIGR01451 family)